MSKTVNRRKSPRLRYRVPVHFSPSDQDEKTTSEGQILDISSGGIAFTCKADKMCPYQDQVLSLDFKIPQSEHPNSSKMGFTRTGSVIRVQDVNSKFRNIAVRFDVPLPVGKVFFDHIGLYLSGSQDEPVMVEGHFAADKNQIFDDMLIQRIEELEHELEELKHLKSRI